jgi:hypothetical protein
MEADDDVEAVNAEADDDVEADDGNNGNRGLILNSFVHRLVPILAFLQNLVIESVPLTTIPKEVFMIRYVTICITPDTVALCPWITATEILKLDISGASRIPEWIANIKTIIKLGIVNSNISQLDQQASVFEHCNIEILELPDTIITSIPEYMYLTSLKLYCHQSSENVTLPFNRRAVKISEESENKLRILLKSIFGVYINMDMSTIGGDEAREFCIWLERLDALLVSGAYGDKQSILSMVKNILDNMSNVEFKEFVMSNISSNNTDCSDRSGMLLNVLYYGYRIFCFSDEISLADKISLLLSASRTHSLRIGLVNHFSDTNSFESVETFLRNEIAYAKEFKFLTYISSMRYTEVGVLFIRSIVKSWVVNPVFENAIQFSFFDKIANSDPEYVAKIDSINEHFSNETIRILNSHDTDAHALLNIVHHNQKLAVEKCKLDWLINTRLKLGDPADPDDQLIPANAREKLSKC